MAERGKQCTMVPPDGGWGWMIVAACFITNICTRAVTRCISIFFVEFQREFSQGYSGNAWIHALADSMTMLWAPLGSFIVSRVSTRVAVILGGVLSSAGLVLSSFATSLEYLYFSMGLLTGVGFALCYTPAVAMVGTYFSERKVLAFGIAMSGSGIGTFVLPPAVQLLIELFSWRGALLILGGLVSHLCVCGALMRPLERPRRRAEDAESGCSAKAPPDSMLTHTRTHTWVSTLEKTQLMDTEDLGNEMPVNGKLADVKSAEGLQHLTVKLADANPADANTTDTIAAVDLQLTHPTDSNITELVKQMDTKPTDTIAAVDLQLTHPTDSNITELVKQMDTKPTDTNEEDTSQVEPKLADRNQANTKLADANPADTKLADSAQLEVKLFKVDWVPLGSAAATREYGFLLRPDFLLLLGSFLFLAYGCSVPLAYLVPYAQGLEVASQHAALLMSILGVSGIVGNLTYGWITDRKCLRPYRLVSYMLAVGLEGLSCLFLPLLQGFSLLVPFALVYGYFDGAYVTLIPIVISDIVGPTHLSLALGVVYFFHAIPYLISPPIGGWLVDQTGSYTASFFLSGFSLMCSSAIVGTLALIRFCWRTRYHGNRSRSQNPPKAWNNGQTDLFKPTSSHPGVV